MLLWVGLGNPGPEHAGNRHNIGYLAVEAIAERHAFGAWRRSNFHGLAAEGEVGGQRVLALKPTTYMNDSGRAAAAALRFYKLETDAATAFHDELDLFPGKVRVKRGGGNAGHNGLRSLDAHIGNDFWRVRMGIGHPGHKDLVHPWVLGDFAKADRTWVLPVVEAVAEAAPLLAKGDGQGFMTKVAFLTGRGGDEGT